MFISFYSDIEMEFLNVHFTNQPGRWELCCGTAFLLNSNPQSVLKAKFSVNCVITTLNDTASFKSSYSNIITVYSYNTIYKLLVKLVKQTDRV